MSTIILIFALGYHVQSQTTTRFRRWATQQLHKYIPKGFAMNDERLKQGGNRYFRELLQRIRNIRGNERNFYQQVTDIYATATDYDSHNEMTKMFFATVQNKLHYAVYENALGLQFILNFWFSINAAPRHNRFKFSLDRFCARLAIYFRHSNAPKRGCIENFISTQPLHF